MVSAFHGNALQFRIDLAAHKILPNLPLANQGKLIAANERLRRQWT